jgi:hypothetical protein
MSFASQIISSVNNKNNNGKSTTPDETMKTSTIQVSDPISSSDKDVGFETDIDTQIKQSNIKDFNKTASSDIKSSVKTTNNMVSNINIFSVIFPFIQSYYFIICIFIFLIVLHHYNIEVFGNLGDLLDHFIEIFYKIFKVIADAFQPLTNTIYRILDGTSEQTLRTVAVGTKEIATKNAEITDSITNPIIRDSKNIKIDKKLKADINSSSKQSLKDVSNDNVDSSIQKKSDWCYIGEDQGVRKCVQVGDSQCLSGLVYKSSNNCINNIN